MIEWNKFKAFIMLKKLTIKKWCVQNNFDRDRLTSIMNGRAKAKPEEIDYFCDIIKAFDKEVKGG